MAVIKPASTHSADPPCSSPPPTFSLMRRWSLTPISRHGRNNEACIPQTDTPFHRRKQPQLQGSRQYWQGERRAGVAGLAEARNSCAMPFRFAGLVRIQRKSGIPARSTRALPSSCLTRPVVVPAHMSQVSLCHVLGSSKPQSSLICPSSWSSHPMARTVQ